MIGDPEAEASSSREGWKHRHVSQCPLEAGEGAPSSRNSPRVSAAWGTLDSSRVFAIPGLLTSKSGQRFYQALLSEQAAAGSLEQLDGDTRFSRCCCDRVENWLQGLDPRTAPPKSSVKGYPPRAHWLPRPPLPVSPPCLSPASDSDPLTPPLALLIQSLVPAHFPLASAPEPG